MTSPFIALSASGLEIVRISTFPIRSTVTGDPAVLC
jgi:hypothetical protein